jgi:hypothetical protein
MTVTELQQQLYKTNADHGFNDPYITMDQKMLLVIREITEAVEELRAGKTPVQIYFPGLVLAREDKPSMDQIFEFAVEQKVKPEGFPIELVDAIIRLFNMVSDLGYSVEQLVVLKDAYNQSRPFKHGGKAF